MRRPNTSALKRRVAENVRRVRREQGMTQTKLCEAADLDLRHIARIEAAGTNSGRGLGAWLKEHGPT